MPRKPEIARNVRGFAGAVGAEHGDDLPGLHRRADALHRRDGAVIDDLELFDREQRGLSHFRAHPPVGRYLNGHNRK